MERTDDRQVKSSICLLFSEKLFTWTLPLVVYHACKASQPDQIFYPHFPYLLPKPTKKGDEKPTQKPSLLQACWNMGTVFSIKLYFISRK